MNTANAVCMLFVQMERFSVACYGILFCFVQLVWSLAENYCEMSWSSLWWTKMADKSVELDKGKWASLVSRYKFLYNRRWFQCSILRFSSISHDIMYHWHAAYLRHILVKKQLKLPIKIGLFINLIMTVEIIYFQDLHDNNNFAPVYLDICSNS